MPSIHGHTLASRHRFAAIGTRPGPRTSPNPGWPSRPGLLNLAGRPTLGVRRARRKTPQQLLRKGTHPLNMILALTGWSSQLRSSLVLPASERHFFKVRDRPTYSPFLIPRRLHQNAVTAHLFFCEHTIAAFVHCPEDTCRSSDNIEAEGF